MASTPMDIDLPDSSPANGSAAPPTSLNITRTLGASISNTGATSEIIGSFRPTKVFQRDPFLFVFQDRSGRAAAAARNNNKKKNNIVRKNKKKRGSIIVAASVSTTRAKPAAVKPSPLRHVHLASNAASAAVLSTAAAMAPRAAQATSKAEEGNLFSRDGGSGTSNRSDALQLFRRDDPRDGRPPRHVLSLDYDDPGELLMTSESDETIQIFKVRDGHHDKMLLSKKYGIKLAKFTHSSSAIIYASTKQNDAIRYLTTHDNAFLRYFEGHEAAVTCLEMHPGSDKFISCSKDNTVRLWDASTRNAYGLLHLNTPYLTAFDPSGQVFAVGSPSSGTVLLYDHRNFDKAPFAEFDIVEACHTADYHHVMHGWTKLEFANDGRTILLGTKGDGHFLIDSFDGHLKAYLRKPDGNKSSRLAAGEDYTANGGSSSSLVEGGGDCCFTSDGRYVIGGTRKGVVVWDTLSQTGENKRLDPTYTIDPPEAQESAVVAWNPRFNFLTTADRDVMFWLPDPEA